jgi:hypothetical protein
MALVAAAAAGCSPESLEGGRVANRWDVSFHSHFFFGGGGAGGRGAGARGGGGGVE